jgi:hypothetical protein
MMAGRGQAADASTMLAAAIDAIPDRSETPDLARARALARTLAAAATATA